MSNNLLVDFIKKFKEFEQEKDVLSKDLRTFLNDLEEGRFFDSTFLSALVDRINTYRQGQDYALVQAEKFNVSAKTMADVEKGLQELLAKSESAQKRAEILDFFRLTSPNAKTVNALETMKASLKEICNGDDDSFKDAIDPYRALVEFVFTNEDCSDELYEHLHDVLPTSICRGLGTLEKGSIVLDNSIDIGYYLSDCFFWQMLCKSECEENSGQIEAEDELCMGEDTADSMNEFAMDEIPEETVKKDTQHEEKPDEERRLESTTKQEVPITNDEQTKAEKQADLHSAADQNSEVPENESNESVNNSWNGYSSYIGERFEAVLEHNASIKDISASQFKKHVLEHSRSMGDLLYLMMNRLIPDVETPEYYDEHGYPKKAGLEYLVKHDYCAKCIINDDGKTNSYYVTSSKAFASIRKESIKKILDSSNGAQKITHASGMTYPVEKWTQLYFCRIKMLLDNTAYTMTDEGEIRFFPSNTLSQELPMEIRYISESDDSGGEVTIPAIFEKGNEQRDVDIIEELTQREHDVLVLLTKRTNDIPILARHLSEESASRFLYISLEEPTVVYDRDLTVVGERNTTSRLIIMHSITSDTIEPALNEQEKVHIEQDVTESTENVSLPTDNKGDESGSIQEGEDDYVIEKEQVNSEIESPVLHANQDLSQEYLDKARRAYELHRPDVGSVILKGICKFDDYYRIIEQWYAYATGDPMLDTDYRASNLLKTFDKKYGIDEEHDLLATAAWIRMCFSEAAGIEIYLSQNAFHMQDSIAYKYSPSVRDLIFELSTWLKSQTRGLDMYILNSVLRQNGISNQMETFQREAKELLDNEVLTKSSHLKKRILYTRQQLFGSESALHKALQAVAANDKPKIGLIKETLKDYISFQGGSVIVNEDNVLTQMDNAWRNTSDLAKGKGRTEPLVGVERNTLSKKLIHVYMLVGNWIQTAENTIHVSSSQNEKAIQLIKKITPILKRSSEEITSSMSGVQSTIHGMTVLNDTLLEMLNRINGILSPFVADTYYIRLLKEPYVAVDDNFFPYIEETKEQVRPYAFCKRAEKYLFASEKTWPEVIKRFFVADESHTGGDYGCAAALKLYIDEYEPELEWPVEYDIDKYIVRALDKTNKRADAVNIWQQNFAARMEMADGDCWFSTTNSKDYIEHVRLALYETYCLQNNFGFYGRALKELLQFAHDNAMALRPVYQQRLDNLKEKYTNDDEASVVLDRISKLINSDKFGAAEGYLQQAEQEEFKAGGSGLTDGNVFTTFVSRCGSLCEMSKLNTKMVDNFRNLNKYKRNNIINTGIELLSAWPETRTTHIAIHNILKNMGLEVEQVTSTQKDGTSFHAKLKSLGRIENYPHPIADFGSTMYEKGLDIALIFGNKTPDSLFTDINGILQKSSGNPTVILVNCAIRLSDRRVLARRIYENLRITSPCLVMDRALVRYLAEIPLNERWKAFIQCALPFQPVIKQNPFKENSSVEIPPEMFIGRRKELYSIIDPSGVNLIYGGRQLGKTALLQRAKTLQHHPEDGNWSIYVDVKNMGMNEAATQIAKHLMYSKFFGMKRVTSFTWDDLCDGIESRMMSENGSSDRLLLLIDEADYLLLDSEKDGYKGLDQLKRLQNTTRGRLKFVMAGLHNLVRFNHKASENNSGIPQLNGMTIKPLDFADARELLELPLGYLGFSIPSGEEDVIAQILYNTNYFPGLVQFYASRLVQYMQKTANQTTMPPYTLDREVLIRLLGDEDFRNMRVDRLKMTLGIDASEHSYYDLLAYALCYSCYSSEEVMLYGQTAAEIYNECININPDCMIKQLGIQRVEVLLDELVVLNILRKEESGAEVRYLFSRPSFVEMLGNKTEVDDHFLDILTRS